MVENEEIGDVRMVSIRLMKHALENSTNELPWRVKPEIAGGGHFYDLASHQFDYLDYLFGPVSEIKSFAGNQLGVYPAEDVLTATWKPSLAPSINDSYTFTFFNTMVFQCSP